MFVLARGQIVLLTRAVFSSPTLNIMLNTQDDNVSYSSADICKTTMLLIINESDLKQLTAEFLGRYAVTLVDKEKKKQNRTVKTTAASPNPYCRIVFMSHESGSTDVNRSDISAAASCFVYCSANNSYRSNRSILTYMFTRILALIIFCYTIDFGLIFEAC